MCYRPAQFLPPEAASDREELAQLGWVAGVESSAPLAHLDPFEGERGEQHAVAVMQHPEVMLASDPQLWRVHDEFAIGARRSISAGDRVRLSNWHQIAVLTMQAAHNREQKRELALLSKTPETAE